MKIIKTEIEYKGRKYERLSLENETDLIGKIFVYKGKDYIIDKYLLFGDGSIWVGLKDNYKLGWQTFKTENINKNKPKNFIRSQIATL